MQLTWYNRQLQVNLAEVFVCLYLLFMFEGRRMENMCPARDSTIFMVLFHELE